MKYIITFICTLLLSIILLFSTFTTSDFVTNLYVLLVSISLLVVSLVTLNLGFKKSLNPRYKKIKEKYDEAIIIKKVVIVILIAINLLLIAFFVRNAVYQTKHRHSLLLEYREVPAYEDGVLTLKDVEIEKLEPEQEVEPVEKEFQVSGYSGTKVTCGVDIPTGEYTVSDSNQNNGTMLFSYFREGEGIAQGEFLAMHEPFTCFEGRQVMAYNDTGSFTLHSFNRIDVRDNYETVDMNKKVSVDKWSGKIEEESCYLIQSDDTKVDISCEQMSKLSEDDYLNIDNNINDLKTSIPVAAMKMEDVTKYYDPVECDELGNHETSIQYGDGSLMCFDENKTINNEIFGEFSTQANELNVWDSDIEDGSLNYD